MGMPHNNLPPALVRLKAALLADRPKAAVLSVLLAVSVVLAIRLLLGRTLPRRAVATPTAAAQVLPHAAAKAPQAAPASPLPDKLLDMDTRISRDLFKVEVDAYPVVVTTRPSEAGNTTKLQLQSIVPGARPTAIINGLVVGVGENVQERVGDRLVDTGFVVQSIEDKACVVTQKGVAVKLEMSGK